MSAALGIVKIFKASLILRFIIMLAISLIVVFSVGYVLRLTQSEYSLTGEEANTHLAKGTSLSKKGEVNAAIAEFKKAVRLDPKNWNAQAQLAYCYQVIGDMKKSASAFKKAVSLNPKAGKFIKEQVSGVSGSKYKATLLNLLGLSYANMGLKTQAVATFKRALAIQPENQAVKENLRMYGK